MTSLHLFQGSNKLKSSSQQHIDMNNRIVIPNKLDMNNRIVIPNKLTVVSNNTHYD